MNPLTATPPGAAIGRLLGSAVSADNGTMAVSDASVLKSSKMDQLVRMAVFGNDEDKALARWAIWELGQAVGVRSASIHDLYIARGQGKCHGFTASARRMGHV